MRNLRSGRTAAIAIMFVILCAIDARAQKVETGYDKSADFSKYKTYAWIPRVNPAANPALATILDQNVEYELNEKGLHKVDSNPDLLVKSYAGPADVQSSYGVEDPNFTATGGYPLPGGNMWGGSLAASPNPHVMTGSITVDLVDAHEKHVVWRGTAKGKVDYEKRSKMLDKASKAIMEMFKKYPPSEGNVH